MDACRQEKARLYYGISMASRHLNSTNKTNLLVTNNGGLFDPLRLTDFGYSFPTRLF